MANDPFSFKEHHNRDPDRAETLDHAKGLRDSCTKYTQASRTLRVRGLRLSKNDYYNLVRSEGSHTPAEEMDYTLGCLKERGFHVRCLEKYIIENNIRQRRVVELIFFCNKEQIRLPDVLSVGFDRTDATFNTNKLNLPLSVVVGVTNTGLTFPVAYCYITSESAECFTFLLDCMKNLIFDDECHGPRVKLGDFAAGLSAAMQRKRLWTVDADAALGMAWQVSQSMIAGGYDCALQLCTWHAAEAIKKRLIKAGTYPVEIRNELMALIWAWIK